MVTASGSAKNDFRVVFRIQSGCLPRNNDRLTNYLQLQVGAALHRPVVHTYRTNPKLVPKNDRLTNFLQLQGWGTLSPEGLQLAPEASSATFTATTIQYPTHQIHGQ